MAVSIVCSTEEHETRECVDDYDKAEPTIGAALPKL